MLIENRSGVQLLEFINISEAEVLESELYKPITGAFAFIKCDNQFLIGYNTWRQQWEFPAGKIEENETPKECAIRELFEETNQKVSNLEYKGLFKVYDRVKEQVKYRMVYFTEISKISKFVENDEMNKVMLWDLKSNIGYFDEVDKKMLELCL